MLYLLLSSFSTPFVHNSACYRNFIFSCFTIFEYKFHIFRHAKHLLFELFETSLELRCTIRKEWNSKNILRLQLLLHKKEKTLKKQSGLASHLGYLIRNMELWLKVCNEEGIEGLLIGAKPRKLKSVKLVKSLFKIVRELNYGAYSPINGDRMVIEIEIVCLEHG